MLPSTTSGSTGPIVYPESDGQPMSDNTRQFRWITILAGNLAALFRNHVDVFVCGNQNWYPVEGDPDTCVAPDVYVVFGRPKGDRSSYKQWLEKNVPMTVVFEVLSPSNSVTEMTDKLAFYEEYGVEEYYIYDPDSNRLHGFNRRGDMLIRVRRMDGFVSPRLGIRFDLSGPELVIRYPDGRPFLTFEQLEAERVEAVREAGQAKQQAQDAVQRAQDAERQMGQAVQRAEQAEQRLVRMAELSCKALRQEATGEEMLELQQLIQAVPPTETVGG